MNPRRLHSWIHKYGEWGVFLVACYLGLRHLWTKRRHAVLIGLALSCAGLLCILKMSAHRPSVSSPQPSVPWVQRTTLPEERSLLRRSTKIADVAEWEQIHQTYHWLPNGTILCFLDEEDGWEANLYHPATRSYQPLTGLTKRLNQADGRYWVSLSPDGRWALWETNMSRILEAATLDGVQHRLWKKTWNNGAIWMADGRHWIGFVFQPVVLSWQRAVIGNVDKPGALQTIRPLSSAMASETPDFMRSESQAFSIRVRQPDIIQADIVQMDLRSSSVPIRRVTVHIPGESQIWGYTVSPAGDRIVWYVTIENVSATSVSSRSSLSEDKTPSSHQEALWVSHIDGSQMHEMGFLGKKESDWGSVEILDVAWHPDGKHLSFIYKDALYTVPAD